LSKLKARKFEPSSPTVTFRGGKIPSLRRKKSEAMEIIPSNENPEKNEFSFLPQRLKPALQERVRQKWISGSGRHCFLTIPNPLQAAP
jgi:hypothetical protein